MLQLRAALRINASDPGGTGSVHTHHFFNSFSKKLLAWNNLLFFFWFKTNPLAAEELHQSLRLFVRNDALGEVGYAGSLTKGE